MQFWMKDRCKKDYVHMWYMHGWCMYGCLGIDSNEKVVNSDGHRLNQ
jgi:hypothetical protein